MEISKKLLSEIFGFTVSHAQKRNENEISIFKDGRTDASTFVNIYELAHKCKEWAFKQCMLLNSGLDAETFYKNHNGVAELPKVNREFFADTEYEAIFKACQWILDNKAKK